MQQLSADKPTTKREGRAAQRARILDALFAVMSSSGAGGASVSEIAEAAGIARGALHYYFESKDELVCALMRRLGETYLARMADFVEREQLKSSSASSSSSSSAFAVRASGGALVRWHFAGDTEEATRLLGVWIDFWGQAPTRKDIGDVVFEVQEGARVLCRRAILLQRPDLVDVDDATLRAWGASLLAIVEGGLLQWRIAARAPRPFDRDALGRALADVANAWIASLTASPAWSVPASSLSTALSGES